MGHQEIFATAIVVFVVLSMAVLVYYLRLKHQEKMELIKKGDYAFGGNYLESLQYSVLSKGIILVSLAIGFGIAYSITRDREDSAIIVVYLMSLLGTTGLGLLGYYFIIKRAVK